MRITTSQSPITALNTLKQLDILEAYCQYTSIDIIRVSTDNIRVPTKDSQLQIRISKELKAALQAAASSEGKELSAWILGQLTPAYIRRWCTLCDSLAECTSIQSATFPLASVSDLISKISSAELSHLLRFPPSVKLAPEVLAYLASMLEHAAYDKKTEIPQWVSQVPPLESPIFGSSLISLREHLLINSPAAYKKRNIFIDSPVGGRV